MKKFIALALVLTIVLSLAACGGDPSKAIIGTWKNSSGYICSFNGDGTGSVNADKGTVASCKWIYDEEAGVWNIDFGYGKGTATVTSGENGPVLEWQGSTYNKVG